MVYDTTVSEPVPKLRDMPLFYPAAGHHWRRRHGGGVVHALLVRALLPAPRDPRAGCRCWWPASALMLHSGLAHYTGISKRFKHTYLDWFSGDVDDAQTWMLAALGGGSVLVVLGQLRRLSALAGEVGRCRKLRRGGRRIGPEVGRFRTGTSCGPPASWLASLPYGTSKSATSRPSIGVAWVVIQPLVTVAAFTLAFERIAGWTARACPTRSSPSRGCWDGPTSLSALAAEARCWCPIPHSSARSTFPRLVAPLASLLPGLVDLGVGLVLLAVLGLIFGVAPSRGPAPATGLAVAAGAHRLGTDHAARRTQCPLSGRALCRAAGPAGPLATQPRGLLERGLEGVSALLYALNPWSALSNSAGSSWWGRRGRAGSSAVSVASALTLAVLGFIYFQRAQRSFADYI